MNCSVKRDIYICGPLSGPRQAHAGLLHRAVARAEQHGITVCVEDDRAEPEKALEVAGRIAQKGALAVIGHFNSACAEAVAPVYLRYGIPLLLPASTGNALSGKTGVFRLCATDNDQVKLMVDWISKKSIDGAAVEIITDESSYSARLEAVLRSRPFFRHATWRRLTESRSREGDLLLVATTCSNALSVYGQDRALGGDRPMLFCDDAHIDGFLSAAAGGKDVYVVGSNHSYEALCEKSVDLVAHALTLQHEDLGSWLARSGHFDERGNAVNAYWSVYQPTLRGWSLE